jgi:hypothetical protein
MHYDSKYVAGGSVFSVTMPPNVGQAVRAAAAREGASVSSRLTEAAADRLRNQLLGATLVVWQQEDGSFTEEELKAAATALFGREPEPAP